MHKILYIRNIFMYIGMSFNKKTSGISNIFAIKDSVSEGYKILPFFFKINISLLSVF